MSHKRDNHRFVWTPAREAILKSMHADKVAAETIAARLGCTRAVIEYRLRRGERAAATTETLAAKPEAALIHPRWFDEDYLRNLIEMAD